MPSDQPAAASVTTSSSALKKKLGRPLARSSYLPRSAPPLTGRFVPPFRRVAHTPPSEDVVSSRTGLRRTYSVADLAASAAAASDDDTDESLSYDSYTDDTDFATDDEDSSEFLSDDSSEYLDFSADHFAK
jgi:hypothetical protein